MDTELWDEYCKATNPTAILALLDQIDALTAERDALAAKLRSFEKSPDADREAFLAWYEKNRGQTPYRLARAAWRAAKADRGQS